MPEETTTGLDVKKATELVTEYLESIYGNLNMSLFRIENVRENGNKTKYLVLCSLITSLGSSKRTYYFLRVDIADKKLLSINKGFKDSPTGEIKWERVNLPPEEEEEGEQPPEEEEIPPEEEEEKSEEPPK